ncbi:hypothetical protein BDZ89DRAFT_1165104 [Hymenopellis radicata]|nr:hypothetical protein BDZ89DRAFT_1165104 [Hymenopellis radicata]
MVSLIVPPMSTTSHSDQTAEEWARKFYILLDSKDYSQLAEQYLTEDVVFNLGDLPPAAGMRASVTNLIAVGNFVMAAVHVTYKLVDFEETRSMRGFGVFTFRPSDANKACKYEVYADFTPVNQVLAKMGVE